MASSSLLALLNFSNPSATSSSSPAPPRHDDESGSISIDTSSPSPIFGPAQANPSSAAANDLLQSILSPNLKAASKGLTRRTDQSNVKKEILNPKDNAALAASPLPSVSNATSPPRLAHSGLAKSSSNDLLALLSGRATGSGIMEADKPDGNAQEGTSFPRSDQTSRQRPIGTPPGSGSRAEVSRSPVPTVFDSPNIFDILRQPVEIGEKEMPKANKLRKEKDTAIDPLLELVVGQKDLGMPSRLSSSDSPSNESYIINPRMHASQQISSLHASAGFQSAASGGLHSIIEDNGAQHISLDLNAPQSAGPSSLYPAKLEITPISVLTTSFTPSYYIDSHQGSPSAQWPCQRVGSLQGRYAMYIMSKARIRIINQENGNRHFAKTNAVGIRSIITPLHGDTRSSRPLVAAITGSDSLCVWSLEDLAPQQEAKIVANIQAEASKSFTAAIWRLDNKGAREIVVLQSDGVAAVLAIKDLENMKSPNEFWLKCPKTLIATPTSEDHYPVSITLSSDGSLVAIIEATKADPDKLLLHLISLTKPNLKQTVELPTFTSFKASRVSFSCFATQADSQLPRCLIIGFDLNQTIAVMDMTNGTLKEVYRFDSAAPSFSIAAWHAATSTLLLCCSIRSSIFSLRFHCSALASMNMSLAEIIKTLDVPNEGSLDQGLEVLYRIKRGLMSCDIVDAQPKLRECALPDPYSSLCIDGSSSSVLLLATYIGGVHSLTLPEEALKQTFVHLKQQKVEDMVDLTEVGTRSAQVNVINTVPQGYIENRGKQISPARPALTQSQAQNKTAQNSKAEGKRKGHKTNSKGRANDQLAEATNELRTESAIQPIVQSDVPSKATNEDSISAARLSADGSLAVIEEAIHDSVNTHLRQAIDDAIARMLPKELHEMLMRPDLHQYLTHSITTAIIQPVQKTAMDVVSKAMAPHFESIIMDMTRSIESKMEMSTIGIRKDIVTEQSKALVEAESKIDRLTGQMAQLTQMMNHLVQHNETREKKLDGLDSQAVEWKASSTNGALLSPPREVNASNDEAFATLSQAAYASNGASKSQTRPSQWMARDDYTPVEQMQDQEVEDVLLSALSSPNIDTDIAPLRVALGKIQAARGSPAQALSSASSAVKTCVTQAVILTLFHRLVQSLNGSTAHSILQPEMSVPWMETCASHLNRNDQSIQEVFGHIQKDLLAQVINAHRRFRDRCTWWTNERLAYGILQYLQ